MSAFFCWQVLVSTESATSGQWATFRCVSLSALPGRLGRVELVPDGLGWKKVNQRTCYSIRLLPGDSEPFSAINTAANTVGDEAPGRVGTGVTSTRKPKKTKPGGDRYTRTSGVEERLIKHVGLRRTLAKKQSTSNGLFVCFNNVVIKHENLHFVCIFKMFCCHKASAPITPGTHTSGVR